jgi:hypothetical protein
MAIIYSYPKVTSPLATDVLVLTDTTLTAGKRKNKTKSLAMSDLAAYVVSSTSGITGSGTLNTIAMFTPDGAKIGDSGITQASAEIIIIGTGISGGASVLETNLLTCNTISGANLLTIQGNSIIGNEATDILQITSSVSDYTGTASTIAGQVLASNASSQLEWTDIADISGTVTGTGTTNTFPIWTDGPNGGIGDSQLRQLGPNANGVYQIRMENTDRFIINKPSSVTSGDPEYLITQDGNFKVSMGWDDDGAGYGYLYNWAGDGWRFGSAGNNPELTIVTTVGSEGVTIANDLFIDGTTTTAGDLYIERGLKDGDNAYGTAGQVLSTTGAGQNVKWVDPSAAITKLIPYFQLATPGGSDTYTQSNNIVDFDWSGGSGTYEYILPSATAIPYRTIRFVNNSTITASDKIHITAPGTETIDGGAFYVINKPYNGCAVWSDGAQWIVIQAKG